LIRVVRTTEGTVMIDPSGKMNGRGAYLKRDVAVFEKAQKSGVLARHLEVSIPNEIFDSLQEFAK